MAKQIKTALEVIRDESDSKSDYFLFVDGDRDEQAEQVIVDWMETYAKQFRKKEVKLKLEIPQDKVIEYNEMFPKIKSRKTGKYLRCNVIEISKSFQRFFKDYHYEWNVIFEATSLYLQEEEAKNYEWTVRSKYFVSKLKDGTEVSELAEYCDRVLNGDDFEEKEQGFEPKVY